MIMKRTVLKMVTALFIFTALGGGIFAPETHAAVANAQSQNPIRVTGKVVDQTGAPLVGVSIVETGNETNGTMTSVDGTFAINVPAGAQLTVTYIGFKTQTVTASTGRMNITLNEDTVGIDDVVVVGYGVQKKANLTGSVSTVNSDDLEMRPVVDATQSLQGLVPGLVVTNGDSGRPGSTGSLQLRGQGNLSGSSSPYVLVDGVEMSLSDVNPNDIESISVLKDASASAIYGARAAYGVILVTTKKGQEGQMRVSYQGNFGWNAPTVLPDMANSLDFAEYWNAGAANANAPRMYSEEKIAQLGQFMKNPSLDLAWADLNGNNNLNAVFENSENGVGNTDYFKLHYKNWAFKQSHNISLSGGSKKAQYYVSGNFYNEDGILRYADMGYQRFNLAANIKSELTSWLSLTFNTKFIHSDVDTPFGSGGISEGFYHSLARFFPTKHYIDPNGRFTELSMIPYLQSGTYTTTGRDRFSTTLGLQVQPVKNWFINADYTYKFGFAEYEAMNVAPKIYNADNETYSLGTRDELGMSTDGRYTRSNSRTRYQSLNIYTSYNFTAGEKNNFNVMLGFQEEQYGYAYIYNTITGLYSTSTPNVSMGTGTKSVTDTRNGWATRGFFGRINYDYDGRYLLELNGRYDGSSRFAADHRWGFFPSVSAGWNIANEAFAENARDVLDVLKVRLSWGLLGNQAGAALYTFSADMGMTGLGGYLFADGQHNYLTLPTSGGYATAHYPANIANPLTTWEKVDSKNIGIDFGLLGNRLTGSLDLFQRDTKDMLGPGEDYPDMFGANAPQSNNANMRNRGWEFAVNWRGRIGKSVSYSVGGSISDATAVVTKYNNPTGTNPSGSWYKGRKVGEIWGYRTDGLIQTQAEADAYNERYDLSHIASYAWEPGDVKYRDINGDGLINNGNNTLEDMGDMEIIGSTMPRYMYTINGSIKWKGLALSLMFQGVGKRDWWPGGSAYFWGCGPYAQVTVLEEHVGTFWTPDNPKAYYPRPYIHAAGTANALNAKNRQTSDRYMQNAAYCRLKNLTLSYELPKKWMDKIHFQKMQVYFSAENIWTISKLPPSFDPEAIFTSNTYTGEGGKNYPMNQVLSVGLVINL